MAKKIFIAATMQNDGKTTVSLGLIAAFKKRFERVGFIKPIGQRYLIEQGYKVDEDSVLIEEVFGIKCNIKDMSPIAIEKGFTERFIDKGPDEDYSKLIKEAYEHVSKDNDLVIIEGTGHAGVGSVFNLSNASVAKLLDANVLLISSGGIGKPIDEFSLNKALFDREGVNLAGVVVNKVLPEKYDKIARFVRKGLEQKGMSVLGVLPYQRVLDIPTIREVMEELKLEALYQDVDFDQTAERILIGAMNVRDALPLLQPRSMVIVPGDRDDMVKAICNLHMGKMKKACPISGLILCGAVTPKRSTTELLKRSRIPALATKDDTYAIAARVNSMTVKLKPQDAGKIKIIVDMIEKYVDIDKVLAKLK